MSLGQEEKYRILLQMDSQVFAESKKLVPNSRYRPLKLTLLNDGRIVVSDVIGAERNSLVE